MGTPKSRPPTFWILHIARTAKKTAVCAANSSWLSASQKSKGTDQRLYTCLKQAWNWTVSAWCGFVLLPSLFQGSHLFFVALKKQELGFEAESQPKVGAIELPKSALRPKQELRHTSFAKLSSPCSVDLVDFYNFTGFYCKLCHEAVPATFREALEWTARVLSFKTFFYMSSRKLHCLQFGSGKKGQSEVSAHGY